MLIWAMLNCLSAADDRSNILLKPVKEKAEIWGDQVNGVQMSIRSANGATLATNSPVIIVLRYKLTSTNGFIFTAGRPIEQTMGLHFTVISPDGKDISPALSETENQSARPRFVILRPGEETEIQYDLSKRCSFDKPGVYKITAAHLLVRHPQKGGRFRVTSNPLGVKITATNSTAMNTQ